MLKAVLVEDSNVILEELRLGIPWEKYNCQVVGVASDGVEGRGVILREKPDILFTDIQMPQMDGLVMLAGLRSEMPSLQITVLTSHRNFEYAQTAIMLGVARFLTKPAHLNELEEALAFMCARVNAPSPPENNPEDAKESAQEENSGSFLVRNALKYIDAHYSEKLTLSVVADSTYVSQWHLSKLLGKHTGKSFSDILNGVRLAHAKELLLDPALHIYEISKMVGFSDVAHFSKMFKKYEGVSPNVFRNNSV